ncbi:AAA family ATPase [Ferrovibrio terrae]|uniref:AAA family ATPase n=1 Tax=Ferrovibrio terrae TaxID=2594003 RepID=UPI0031378BB5
MKIAFVEISNFRKLLSVRLDFADETTLLVGANNSGKTSAMLALRRFLVDGGKHIRTHDLTLSHWSAINAIGDAWVAANKEGRTLEVSGDDWVGVMPVLDVWLTIEDGELHHVGNMLPTLDWPGGRLGIRLRMEPKKAEDLFKQYVEAVKSAEDVKAAVAQAAGDQPPPKLTLWPADMIDFLNRHIGDHFVLRAYPLDPARVASPVNGHAKPQPLPESSVAFEGNPLSQLIRVNEINAQRGFGQSDDSSSDEGAPSRESRRLSDQLRLYYTKHLDPSQRPGPADIGALQAIEAAQDAFDERLKESFEKALREVEGLGYPGVTDPKLKVSTRLRAVDALDHDAAVSYEIEMAAANGVPRAILRLPEDQNGLGYQNLISMVFRLMSFRDAWMRVGKADRDAGGDSPREPLHLVLVEEPEAHLHAQVQQVFIKKAYKVLRDHVDLGRNGSLRTQLIVSTHSSHVAHETPFSCLRYFRRLPAGVVSEVPVSIVVNMTEVFGPGDETKEFVTRYLRAQHADLFFADAAILVEGPAERMLVPHFILRHHQFLNQCYITLLEIGGSHAHQLKPLIKHIGLLTLVVSDLDATGADGKAVPVMPGAGQISGNETIKTWAPGKEPVDELLTTDDREKVVDNSTLSAVRVAYQTAIQVTLREGVEGPAYPYTFEDALVWSNVECFKDMDGNGLVRKFREALAEATISEASEKMFNALRKGKKAEFALDVIALDDFESLTVPAYIADGLKWLEEKLQARQVEVLPPIVGDAP